MSGTASVSNSPNLTKFLLTDEVIEALQSATEFCNYISTCCYASQIPLRTLVALHDDPDFLANASVDQLQWEQLAGHGGG